MRRKDIPSSTSNDTNIDTPTAHDIHIDTPPAYDGTPPAIVRSRHDEATDDIHPTAMPIVNPEDLIGRTFLLDEQEDGQKFREKLLKLSTHTKKVFKITPHFFVFVAPSMIMSLRKYLLTTILLTISIETRSQTSFGSSKTSLDMKVPYLRIIPATKVQDLM